MSDRYQLIAYLATLATLVIVLVAALTAAVIAPAFRRGDWRQGCDLVLAWDKARLNGRTVAVPGLTARRRRERAMCLVGVAA